MRHFDVKEWRKYPRTPLVIEEYKKEGDPEVPLQWPVLNSQPTFDNYIAIQVNPDLMGGNINSVIIPDQNGGIYNFDKHLIGYLRFLPIVMELWGITFQYENEDGQIFRRLMEGNPKFTYPFFESQLAAFTWLSKFHFYEFINDDYNKEKCSFPLPKLIDCWLE